MSDRLLIILATGPEDRGSRATLAFAMGVSALVSGVETAIFLTMGGTFWSRPKSNLAIQIDGFDPLIEYMDQFVDGGGEVLVCSPCDAFYCSIANETPLMQGAALSGLTHVVDFALDASVVTL